MKRTTELSAVVIEEFQSKLHRKYCATLSV